MNIQNFEDANLNEQILIGIFNYGYEKPSLPQQTGIPVILSGQDCILQFKSGTGKTGAFCIPILQQVLNDNRTVIIVNHQQNLNSQTYKFLKDIIDGGKLQEKIKLCLVESGIQGPKYQQMVNKLKTRPNIICGTTGKLSELLRTGKIKQEDIGTLIIDEFDYQLVFQVDQLKDIVQNVRQDTQLCLISATCEDDVLQFINDNKILSPGYYLHKLKYKDVVVQQIKQFFTIMPEQQDRTYIIPKVQKLYEIIQQFDDQKILVFFNRKKDIDQAYEQILQYIKEQQCDIKIARIHKDLDKDQCITDIDKFNKSEIRVVLASDALSRGIDIQRIDIVINFDIQLQNNTQYLQRIGRSARMGNKGVSITFISSDAERKSLLKITKEYECTIDEFL